MKTYISNFLKYKSLLRELVVRDIKLKYRRSILGLLWSLLNPLLMMIVLTIIFSSLFKRNIDNFPVYLLTGRMIFVFFSETTNQAMMSIISNSSLIKKVYLPKYILPLSKALSSYINLMFSLLALIIVMIVTKIKITWVLILFPLPLIYTLIFSIGVGLVLSTYAVFFRDLVHLYSVLLTAWMYFTPIFYPVEIIPERYLFLVKSNPLYYIVQCFREIVLYGRIPSLSLNLICLAIAIITLFFGLIIFYKNQNKFILYI